MKKAKLQNLRKVVEEILQKDKLARKDDCYLILEVIRKLFPLELGKTFASVMFNAKSKGISFESITRVRRKVQRKYPELKDKETAELRDAERKEYIDFSRES